MKTNHSSEFLGTEKISKLLFSFSMPCLYRYWLAVSIISRLLFFGFLIGFSSGWGGISFLFKLYNAFANDFRVLRSDLHIKNEDK